MRKRWVVNWHALAVIGIAWFVAAFILALLEKPNEHTSPPFWAIAVLFGPFVLALTVAALYGIWVWLRSESGWLVRRVEEPLTDDLREQK